ncbi:MAG TPA: hypothetical protein VN787_02895 [Steroidobacteraceae bacterium]|nr:hypothetical protein [Steroidobacteraceae bacterium]
MGVSAALFGLLSLAATGASAAAKGSDPFVGHWTLNATKSEYSGMTGGTSGKVAISAVKGGIKSTVDVAFADGHATHYEVNGKADGSEIVVAGSALFDSATMLRPDRHTVIRTERRGGKLVGITTITVSADGRTLTAMRKGISTAGPQPSYTTVWDRARH